MENLDAPGAPGAAPSNVPEFSVSELSFALKREIESSFPRVRVRGDARRCGCGNGCAQVTPQVWYAGVGVGAQV